MLSSEGSFVGYVGKKYLGTTTGNLWGKYIAPGTNQTKKEKKVAGKGEVRIARHKAYTSNHNKERRATPSRFKKIKSKNINTKLKKLKKGIKRYNLFFYLS